MSLAAQIARNTFYQVIGKFFSTVLGLISIMMMTRYLGATGFGQYTTATTLIQFFAVLIDFGLQMTGAQMLGRDESRKQQIFNNIFSLRIVSAVILLGSAVAIAWLMPYPLIVKQASTIVSVSFFLIALSSTLTSLFQKQLDMATTASAEVWGRVALVLGIWLAIQNNWGLLPIMTAMVIGSLVNFATLYFKAHRYLKIKWELDLKVWKEIWNVSWPLAITIALTLVYFRADTIILSLFRSQAEVGIYGAAYKVLDILVQFPYMFLGLLLPLLSKFYISNRELYQKTIAHAFDFLVIVTFPLIAGSIVLGRQIMIFVAGPEFAISGDLLGILVFALGAIYIAALFGYGIVAAGLQKKMIRFYAADAIVSIILYLILIPIYSYWAAAILTVFTEAWILIGSYLILKRHTGIKLRFTAASKALVAAIVMAVILWALPPVHIFILTFIGIIVYFTVLLSLRGVDRATVKELLSLQKS
ncbi:MAG: flippase [Candidatus Buchananbacteria bacterium]|nr:flippase [Candidatus Buchananbacteria bacterium]